MADGDARRRGEGELPPDPWAGLAGPSQPPPPPPGPGGGPDDTDRSSGRARHPSLAPGTEPRHRPPPRRTLWHHPAVWVVVLVLAGILLVGALLEPRPARPQDRAPEPLPDGVTALVTDPASAS